jgi:signal transduction histidine kinase
MLVVVVCVVMIVPLAVDGPAYLIPVWVWWVAAAAYLGTTAWVMFLEPGSGRRSVPGGPVVGVAVQTVLAGVLVVGLPGAGWLPILLVFGAALSTYLVAWPVTAGVIVVNTAALLVSQALSARQQGQEVSLEGQVLGAGLYLLLQVASAFVSAALQREQRIRTELSVAHAELAAAAVLRDEASRASERLRIARELHDLLGHQLTVLTLELESATHRSGEAQAEHIERARLTARELLSDVRSTVGELRRRAPDLREALQAVAAAVPTPRVEVVVADDVTADEEQTAALVRVAQEAATNAVRHAYEATSLRIEVRATGGDLTLVAHDDGYSPGEIRPGNGLRGLTERVEALGGSVRFDGTKGFWLEVAMPVRVAS